MGRAILGFGAVSLLAVLIGAATFRLGWLPFRISFTTFGIGLLGCALAVAAAVGMLGIAWFRQQPAGQWLLLLLVCALPLALVFGSVGVAGLRAPAIHDISTDTTNPPRFVFAAADRSSASNSIEYGGEAIAARQREAYPDLCTLRLPGRDVPKIFAAARRTVQAQGWRILGEDAAAGHLEAVSTTALMGFQDDIAIRVQPSVDGVAVDVRSASRVGVGDLGANARRIRVFLDQLTASL